METEGRGILFPARLPTFHRIPAPEAIADRVGWFWTPEWDIAPGRVSRQHLIAFPVMNLAVEPDLVGLAGPTTRRSFRDLAGSGWTVGALPRPAAVPTLAPDPTRLRDRYLRLELPELHDRVATIMRSDRDPAGRRTAAAAVFADWVGDRVPVPDEEGRLANRMADLLDGDASIDDLPRAAARLHVSTRTLQRLAARYVGLSVGEMIRRRRLQEAAEQVRSEPEADLAGLDAELGYADHAHLTREFRRVLGFTPSGYRKESRP